jgi:hypothetical protein
MDTTLRQPAETRHPTEEELKALPSIWDGWTNKCKHFFELCNGYTGIAEKNCALGAVGFTAYNASFEKFRANPDLMRVGKYLIANDPRIAARVQATCYYAGALPEWEAITFANNKLDYTPDDFRRIDRLSQWEELQRGNG